MLLILPKLIDMGVNKKWYLLFTSKAYGCRKMALGCHSIGISIAVNPTELYGKYSQIAYFEKRKEGRRERVGGRWKRGRGGKERERTCMFYLTIIRIMFFLFANFFPKGPHHSKHLYWSWMLRMVIQQYLEIQN